MSKFKDIIERKRPLSFSTFNSFFESPYHFIKYCEELTEPTDAMKFGSLCHALILEPDKVEEKYFIVPDYDRRTKAGKEAYETALIEAGDMELVRESVFAKAKEIKEKLFENKPAMSLLNQITETEKRIEFEFDGWDWVGFVDGIGDDIIVDLKKVADANPYAVRSGFFRMGYHRQAFLYLHGTKSLHKRKYYIVAFDEKGGISCHFVDSNCLTIAENELKTHLNNFMECILLDRWNENYEFYCPNDDGIFVIAKSIQNIINS